MSRSQPRTLIKATLRSRIAFYLKHLLIWCVLGGVVYWAWLDRRVVAAFNARKWELPARIYATPLDLYRNFPITAESVTQALTALGYRDVAAPSGPGQFRADTRRVDVVTRGFTFADGEEPARMVRLEFGGDRITKISEPKTGVDIGVLRFEPLEIGRIHTAHFEDRVLLARQDLPEPFVRALTVVEDRRFFEHIGIDWSGILRALWVNLLHREIAQGGSTLTQQLVKNLYLDARRTLGRKLNEALMALSIERQFSKSEILETYANEVFLGQDGNRAIHGFGLAARFYFGRPLSELSTPELALLVGLVRGPSRYNPFKFPERALARRAVILEVFRANGLVSSAHADAFKRAPLGLRRGEWRTEERYATYLDLVRRQLKRDYQEVDLRTAGLKVFTSLDIRAQAASESAVITAVAELERGLPKQKGRLQAAVIVTDARTADIKAMIGSRGTDVGGFNRALDAKRQIGSLIKPFIYLTALAQLRGFNVATQLIDEPRTWNQPNGKSWSPQNYDGKYLGPISAQDALAKSLNLATIDLGFRIEVESLRATLRRFGVVQDISKFPALFLGAIDLSPYDVTQLYQIIANDGFRIPLRAIQAVVDSRNQPIKRYGLKVERVIEEETAFLTRYLLTRVVEHGTARRLAQEFPRQLPLAGKTGTSNDARDSWFVGFTGNDLVTVWMGRDDNKPAGLTGATGALKVWVKAVKQIGAKPILMDPPPTVEWHWLTADGAALTDRTCGDALYVPVNINSLPAETVSCTMTPPEQGFRPLWEPRN